MGISEWVAGELARLYTYVCRDDPTARILFERKVNQLNSDISDFVYTVKYNPSTKGIQNSLDRCLESFNRLLSCSTDKDFFDQQQILQFINKLLEPLSVEKYEVKRMQARDSILGALETHLTRSICNCRDLSAPARETLIEKTLSLYLELLGGQSQLSLPNEAPAKRSLALGLLKLASLNHSGRNAAYDRIREETANWGESRLMQAIRDSICYTARFDNVEIICFNPVATNYIVEYMKAHRDSLLIVKIDAFIGEMKTKHDGSIEALGKQIAILTETGTVPEKRSLTLSDLRYMRQVSQEEREKFFKDMNSLLERYITFTGQWQAAFHHT